MSKTSIFVVLSLILALVLVVYLTQSISDSPPNNNDDDETQSRFIGMTIRVGTNAEYPPFEEIDEDGKFVGFDIDLMEALARDAGFKIEWVNTRWDGIFFALAEGEFDAVISATAIRSDRERIVDFTTPYFVASQSISVQVDRAEQVATPDDLGGLTVGVQNGTVGDFYASQIQGVEVARYDQVTLAFAALGNGEVDAVIADTLASAAIIANQPDLNVTLVGEPLTEDFYGIGVTPLMPDLLAVLNTSLVNIFADGTYAEIYEAHFGAEPPEHLLEGTYELNLFRVDMTDPVSVATYSLHNLLKVGDLAEYAAISCEEYVNREDFPKEEDLADLADISFDLSGLEFTSEVDGKSATVVASGNIILDDGTDTFEVAFTDMFDDSTTQLVMLEDGTWRFCPSDNRGDE